MIEELTRYYSDNGILSTSFHCQYKHQCSCGIDDGLIEGKAAYIGKEYENHSLPRILFVSLDMGSDKDFDTREKRTPKNVQEVEAIRNWQLLPSLLHWYETHFFALKIANTISLKYFEANANQIFAHTNSAKCCEKKKGNDMSKDALYLNCRGYIKGELEILDPDIVVGQGDKAFEAVRYSFPEISNEIRFQPTIQIHERIRVYQINDHPVLFLRTTYPSWRNKRTILQRENLYPFYLAAVKTFSTMFLSKAK